MLAKRLLSQVEAPGGEMIGNDRWLWAADTTKIATVMNTRFQTTLIVFTVASSEGHIMPRYFIP